MTVQIDNATAIPKGVQLLRGYDKSRHFESFTLTTLADGHAVPSIFAVTPAPSTKVEELMDTLFDVYRDVARQTVRTTLREFGFWTPKCQN